MSSHYTHRTFDDGCHECWNELITERPDDKFLGIDWLHPTFECDRCGRVGCRGGGVYRTIMLCLQCYKRLHKHHKRVPDNDCAMCEEERYWRNYRVKDALRWIRP